MSDKPDNRTQHDLAPTADAARWIATTGRAAVTPEDLRWARHCLLDWLGVTLAAAHEPLVTMLMAEADADGATGAIPIVGRTERLAPSWATLVNGAASHALDYDDVNTTMHGHPTVAVLPAVLTAATAGERSMDDALRAFAVGYEMCCHIGGCTGDGHYDTGWHATATIGTFGAAAGVAALMDLDESACAHALGSAATMAAGLKSMFGTMSKPFHAGRAAQSGWLAARLAARGWESRSDALECPQGFWATQAPDHAWTPMRPGPLGIRTNLFKYHAACYMTHSSIEACRDLAGRHGLAPDDIASIRLRVAAGHRKMCDIAEPDTGLAVKFSLRHLAAMAVSGVDTAAIDSYTDAIAQRPDLVALRRRVTVEPAEDSSTMNTRADVVIITTDGATRVGGADVGVPATDVDGQEQRLCAKFTALAAPVLGAHRAEALMTMVLEGTATPGDVLSAAQPAS